MPTTTDYKDLELIRGPGRPSGGYNSNERARLSRSSVSQGNNFAQNNSAHNDHIANTQPHQSKERGVNPGPPLLCGCARRTCLIITAAIVGLVLLIGITLGVGLGIGLNQKAFGLTLDCERCSSSAECISGDCGNSYDKPGLSTCAASGSNPCKIKEPSSSRGPQPDCGNCSSDNNCKSGVCRRLSDTMSFCASASPSAACALRSSSA